MARCGGGTHRASGHRAFPDGGDRAPFRWEGAGTSHTITRAVVGPPQPKPEMALQGLWGRSQCQPIALGLEVGAHRAFTPEARYLLGNQSLPAA